MIAPLIDADNAAPSRWTRFWQRHRGPDRRRRRSFSVSDPFLPQGRRPAFPHFRRFASRRRSCGRQACDVVASCFRRHDRRAQRRVSPPGWRRPEERGQWNRLDRGRVATAAPSRRTFVKGLAAGTAAVGLGLARSDLHAQMTRVGAPSVLSGTEFDLRIGEAAVNITGRERTALTINGSMPGPLLRWREGDTVTVRVTNMPRRAHVDPLARHPAARQHGRRARD